MSGPFTLYEDPLVPMEAATKRYVDQRIATFNAANVVMSDTMPSNPTPGMLWWDTVGTQMYIWYTDVNSNQWVNVTNAGDVPANYLPLTGGTLTGPLTLTVTGSPATRVLQDRLADEINILDWGASNTGVDCTSIMQAALATGKNVYMPAGVYRWNKQIVVGISPTTTTSQRLRGDGLGTYIIIEPNFDPTATSVILLQGVESGGPTVQDLFINFYQPTGMNSRASFLPLGNANAGVGTNGVIYPPAILFGQAKNNRFKLERLRFANCWNGIHQSNDGTDSGGWWMRGIEISCYNIGLLVRSNIDMSHLIGWHHWSFQMTAQNTIAWKDGNTFAAQFGVGAQTQSLNIEDFSNFTGRISIDNNGTMLKFANLTLDGDNAGLEVINSLHILVSNVYSTCSGSGPSSGNATFKVQAGLLHVEGYNGWCGLQGMINISGGRCEFIGGQMLSGPNSTPLVQQSGGILRLSNLEWRATGGAWTQPFINCTGGTLIALDNYMSTASVGDVGGIVISTDSAAHMVRGNNFNGWGYAPPGGNTPLGIYGPNGNPATFRGSVAVTNSLTVTGQTNANGALIVGTNTTTANSVINGPVSQRNLIWQTAGLNRWVVQTNSTAEGGSNVGSDFTILNCNDAGTTVAQVFQITRSNGYVTIGANGFGAMVLGINAAAGTNRQILWESAGSTRWALYCDNVTESGSNAGANIRFGRYTDAGGLIDTPLTISRNTGLVNVGAFGMTLNGIPIVAGAGVATGTQPSGSIWIRTDGTAGNRIYVSQGSGTWIPIAGV
jgi:hypothetical protein